MAELFRIVEVFRPEFLWQDHCSRVDWSGQATPPRFIAARLNKVLLETIDQHVTKLRNIKR